MKVPEYNPQVDQVTPQIPETRFSAPPQAAFGEQVDQANENLGKSYEKIGEAVAQHVERQNILQRRIGGHVAEAQVKSDIINHLNDPTPKEMEYKDFQGNKITKQVPSGELLQKDDEAQDAYKSGASYIDDRVTELLKKSDPYEQQRIQFTLLPWAEQQKAHLAEHQQVQTANYYKKSLKTVASGIADDTTVPVENTIASLEKTVPDFVERYHGEDADTQVQKYMLQSARNRVDAQLMADPKDEGKLADITDAFSSKLSDEQMLKVQE